MLQFSRLLTLLSLIAFLTLTGCNGDSADSGSSGNTEHAAGDGHDHDHDGDDHDHEGEDHDDHDHGDDDDHDHGDHDDHDDHDHGDAHELGSVTIDGAEFKVSISGEIEPNAETHIDLVQTGGPKPAAVRLWIGIESGSGSLKSKADGHDNHFHGHAEVPAQIPANAALWIEVESASGNRTARSVALP